VDQKFPSVLGKCQKCQHAFRLMLDTLNTVCAVNWAVVSSLTVAPNFFIFSAKIGEPCSGGLLLQRPFRQGSGVLSFRDGNGSVGHGSLWPIDPWWWNNLAVACIFLFLVEIKNLLTHSISSIVIARGLILIHDFFCSQDLQGCLVLLPSSPVRRMNMMYNGHGSWVRWVMGQLCDGSHGSWGHERWLISISAPLPPRRVPPARQIPGYAHEHRWTDCYLPTWSVNGQVRLSVSSMTSSRWPRDSSWYGNVDGGELKSPQMMAAQSATDCSLIQPLTDDADDDDDDVTRTNCSSSFTADDACQYTSQQIEQNTVQH